MVRLLSVVLLLMLSFALGVFAERDFHVVDMVRAQCSDKVSAKCTCKENCGCCSACKGQGATTKCNCQPKCGCCQDCSGQKTVVGHRCTCGCEETGQCTCPNCSVGCGFLPAPKK
jgi:hypothetical protein